jgi:hypothetical protein
VSLIFSFFIFLSGGDAGMAAAMAAAMSEFDFEEQAARPWQPPAPARCFLHVFFSEF